MTRANVTDRDALEGGGGEEGGRGGYMYVRAYLRLLHAGGGLSCRRVARIFRRQVFV